MTEHNANHPPKRILLLGATGSIGSQTLDVIRQHPDQLELVGVSAGSSKDKLEAIIDEFCTIQAAGLSKARQDYDHHGVPVLSGEEQMSRLIEKLDYDLLVNAAVGFRGLKPTLDSLEKGVDVALANKESLVCGGPLVKEMMKKTGTKLYPIDSEHSAIFQCLQGNDAKEVKRLIITASGGSLRNLGREELRNITPARALAHPNWSMGSRITLDSATMVNKGFEVLEAHYLFDLPLEQIDTVLHDESIIHSMVEYQDHAILAQMGSADMHLPIQYALLYPQRPILQEEKPLDMTKTMNLHFREMDNERFPILNVIRQAGAQGGSRGTVINGADEQAVELFLQEKIPFTGIEESITAALEQIEPVEHPSYTDLAAKDAEARQFVRDYWNNRSSDL